MCRAIRSVDRCLHSLLIDELDKFLKDLHLGLEASEVATVSHDGKKLTDNHNVETNEELCADSLVGLHFLYQVLKAVERELHDLGLLVLAAKNHRLQDRLKAATVQLEKSVCAETDNCLDKLEKAFTELWERREIVTNHLQCWRKQMLQNTAHETLNHRTLLPHHGCE